MQLFSGLAPIYTLQKAHLRMFTRCSHHISPISPPSKTQEAVHSSERHTSCEALDGKATLTGVGQALRGWYVAPVWKQYRFPFMVDSTRSMRPSLSKSSASTEAYAVSPISTVSAHPAEACTSCNVPEESALHT